MPLHPSVIENSGNGFTAIVRFVVEAHCPAFGVKVYVVVARLFNAGDQVPVIPSTEVVDKETEVAPEQIGLIALKLGVIRGFTVIVRLVTAAHCPAVGVNVYVVVAELFNVGDQIPIYPFNDGDGNELKESPTQIGFTALNVGITFGFTVTVTVFSYKHVAVSTNEMSSKAKSFP
jgi:hypothetical protein